MLDTAYFMRAANLIKSPVYFNDFNAWGKIFYAWQLSKGGMIFFSFLSRSVSSHLSFLLKSWNKCFRKTSCLKVWTQSWTLAFCELHLQCWRLAPATVTALLEATLLFLLPQLREVHTDPSTWWQKRVSLTTANGSDTLSLTSAKNPTINT